jgi:hypothetical protein
VAVGIIVVGAFVFAVDGINSLLGRNLVSNFQFDTYRMAGAAGCVRAFHELQG